MTCRCRDTYGPCDNETDDESGLCVICRITCKRPTHAASSGDLPSPSPWGSDKGGER